MPNSSRVVGIGNLTLRVMDGKSGKKRQRGGKVWHGGWQKRHGLAGLPPHPRQQARRCQWVRVAVLAAGCACSKCWRREVARI